ncbi:DUF2784 domain-containing protein [Syntrophorhabdus aromaticivorans]|uniref:DUF2784 domain-containing protein n=1 Tax=Syntrophorhabdus aromaticivorans TaxID=328301 RepID=UPI0003FD10BA|nr:DUF2784 domain-containing protein [Syntrophorhabdus aromaticivorans]
MNGGYALLADLIVIFHLIYVFFAVGGQLAILVGRALNRPFIRNPAFRICHLAAVVIVAVEASIGLFCPLTLWEYAFRQLAGQRVDRDISFIGRLVRFIIFYDLPNWAFTILHISFGLLVMLTFILVPPGFSKRK